jgi:hypothetical protein
MAQQATDSFVTEVDGAPMFVSKGEILPDGHPVLKALGGTHLFRSLQEEPEPKAAPKAAAKAGRGSSGG